MIEVTINGELVELGDDATAADAALAAGAEPGARGVAIAIDGEVVPRARLGSLALSSGQRVEVVTAIQGGS